MEKVFEKVTELPNVFPGKGKVSGRVFKKVKETDSAAMYEVKSENGKVYYEVFVKKLAPLCLDFQKRLYSETEAKVRYPGSNDFGKWAWLLGDLESAERKFNEIK